MPTRNAPPDALVARFKADLARLAGAPPGRMLLAVSGGGDSLALLLLAHAAYPGRCTAATVDHGIRPQAADEARAVAALCAELGIDHAILAGPLPDRADGTANLSTRARALRYGLLAARRKAVGADLIATGHHADDQLETLVMRLNRPSGIGGLAGMPPVNGQIIRPLLGWTRAELAAIVDAARVAAAVDPSNADDRFDRARVRKALAGTALFDPAAVAASMAALREADAAIEWTVDRLMAAHVCQHGDGAVFTLPPDALPAEIVRRIVSRCIAVVDCDARPRGPQLGALIAALEAGGIGTAGSVLCAGGSEWTFRPAPPRRRS